LNKIVDFSKFSSIKIGPIAEVEVINEKQPLNNHFLIGGANNLLISNNPPPLAILGKEFNYIKIEDNQLKVGAATKSGRVFSFCKKHNIGGLEYLGKLPGTMGGLLKMNAGMKSYEIFNNLISIDLENITKEKKDIDFGYRYTDIHETIYAGAFDIKQPFNYSLVEEFSIMRANQPSNPSAGSAFKNPQGDSAGRLIDAVGLKGFKKGGASWSKIHANFLVNLDNATFEDAIFLIKEAKNRVFEEFKIELEEEIIIL